MGTTATNAGYSVTVAIESANWYGRTIYYTGKMDLNAGATYYLGLASYGSLSGTGASTVYINGYNTDSVRYGSARMATIYGSAAANSAGDASVSISGSFGTQYPFYYNGYQIGVSAVSASDSGSWHISTPPSTPAWTEITRNSGGANFYIRYTQPGGGPAVTYYVQRARNAAMTDTLEETGANPNLNGFNWAATAGQTYYFRIKATNSDGTTYSSTLGLGPYYGKPTAPTAVTATRSDSVAGRINIYWTKPSDTQGGIDYYHVYRDGVSGVGTYIGQHNGETAPTSLAPFQDNGLARGTDHKYYVYAHNTSGFWSDVSTESNTAKAPGVPGKPSTVNTPTRVGRNVTVTAPKDSNDYGNTVTAYRIQYATSDDNYATWYGWTGTSGTLNGYNTMNISGSEASFYYSMLTAAKTYKFRVYAVNSIGVGDQTTDSAVLATGWFLPASGKKWDGTSWNPTAIAKRWNPITSTWTDISIAKRYSSITGNWEELT